MELIRDMGGERNFSTDNHFLVVKKERSEFRKRGDNFNGAKLERIFKELDIFNHCLFLLSKQTGYWPTIRSTTVTGTVLLAMVCHDCLYERYNVKPHNP